MRTGHLKRRERVALSQILITLRYNFSIFTWILVGAIVSGVATLLPSSRNYVLLISSALLALKTVNAIFQAHSLAPNPYLEDVIPGRSTALLPNLDTGDITAASSRKVTVFHLGAKANHPYGYFAPQFRKMYEYLVKMNAALDSGEVQGFLGQTLFTRLDKRGAPEAVFISYWNSTEDLWKFAYGDVHKAGWNWWTKAMRDSGYVGLNHEIFEADAKHWENVYINFQPTMMGATTHVVKDGKTLVGGVVDQKWISPLVDASRGDFAKSSGRMGRAVNLNDENHG